MPAESNLIYLYDGTFEGFLCCVFESVYAHTMPLDIVPESQAQPSLFDTQFIPTDAQRAARVAASIPRKISPQAQELVRDVFCSCLPSRELALLRFLRYGYACPSICRHMGHPVVAPLLAAQVHLQKEVHNFLGFVRFQDTGAGLVSRISPKNYVLPYLADHFIRRLGKEDFMIYDDVHAVALLWQNRQASIVPVDSLQLPAPNEAERHFQALWRRFVHTVAIEARRNPRCQMSWMPKRYWPHMTEWQPEPSASETHSLPDGQPAQRLAERAPASQMAQHSSILPRSGEQVIIKETS